jgi:hypothetical protein
MNVNKTDTGFVIQYIDEEPRSETRGGTFGRQAAELEKRGLAERRNGVWCLTEAGCAMRDGIGSEIKTMFRSTRSIEDS